LSVTVGHVSSPADSFAAAAAAAAAVSALAIQHATAGPWVTVRGH
jgi:hypothetical protein